MGAMRAEIGGSLVGGALQRPGASWAYFKEGKTFFNAGLVCKRCKCNFMISTSNRLVSEEAAKDLAQFLLIDLDQIPSRADVSQ